jgi:hypothetical protein
MHELNACHPGHPLLVVKDDAAVPGRLVRLGIRRLVTEVPPARELLTIELGGVYGAVMRANGREHVLAARLVAVHEGDSGWVLEFVPAHSVAFVEALPEERRRVTRLPLGPRDGVRARVRGRQDALYTAPFPALVTDLSPAGIGFLVALVDHEHLLPFDVLEVLLKLPTHERPVHVHGRARCRGLGPMGVRYGVEFVADATDITPGAHHRVAHFLDWHRARLLASENERAA